jgi:hypothetical protein
VPHVARTAGCQPKAVGGSRRFGPCRALSGRRQDGNYLRDDSVSSRYATRTFNSSLGSASMALQISINSTTSTRLSPPSYLATNDCGRGRRLTTGSLHWRPRSRPPARLLPFLAMTGDGHPITDRETEREIGALRAKGAPANARIVPITWLPSIDPL